MTAVQADRELKICVANVSKVYVGPEGNTTSAVEQADFVVGTGEFLVILGPSGCGKSTILRILAGLEVPTTGSVLVDGLKVTGPGSDRGMVFQAYTSFPWLTVAENIAFGLRVQGHAAEEQREIVEHYLAVTGLMEFRDNYPRELSGGMKQRVAIARTLATGPQVLLMDEPFGALDAESRWRMHELLLEIWRRTGVTIVFVTHDIEEALALGTKIYVSTPRPSRPKAVLAVELPRPRIKTDKDFIQMEIQVTQMIRGDDALQRHRA